MTTISNTPGATATSTATAPATKGYGALGMGDFLKLLTTQMKDQDPTQPVDNTQMVAQMAQFSSLSGINTTNTSLATTNSSLASTNTAIGASNTTLASIASKLDALLAAQQAANAKSTPAA